MRTIFLISLVIGLSLCCLGQTQPSYFFEGEIKSPSGKAIRSVKLDVLSLNKSFFTDKKGKFSINLPKGDYLVRIQAAEFKSREVYVGLKKDTIFNLILEPVFEGIILEEVSIQGRNSNKVNAITAGVEKLDKATIERMPALLGEKDPVKALQLLPGVTGSTEGSAEMNVRGGGTDQNRVLLDNIPLYSSTHLFGLYSSFNPLAISNATIYKGDFPAHFGGRLSSVISIVSSDTLSKSFQGTAELGITTGKFNMAVPMFKQKSTLYLAGRRSYYDVLFNLFGKGNADIFKFQDYNLGWIFQPDLKNRIKLSIYQESDAVGTILTETGLSKGSSDKKQSAFGLNWRHRFNHVLTNDLILYSNDYTSRLSEERRNTNLSYLYDFRSSVADIGLKNTLSYTHNAFKIGMGVDLVKHQFKPTQFNSEEFGEMLSKTTILPVDATDLSLFMASEIDFIGNGKLNLGLRNNNYYSDGYAYHSLEPRVSYLQPLNNRSSLKMAYSRMTQPIQRLTNPGLGLPQDIILSSGKDLKPQIADHFSIEFAKDFKFDGEEFSFSIQPFYKRLWNISSFRDGYDTRSLMYGAIYQANDYKALMASGKGTNLGLEIMLEKRTGKLNGWINYTFLKATNTFADLNKGLSFSPPQDRRHNFNVVANWTINSKWNIGLSWMFISGQPVSVPESVFLALKSDYLNGNLMVDADSKYLFEQGVRGNHRMKPFHKLDITAAYKFKLAGLNATWNMGAYNVYNRLNPSFYYLGKSKGGQGKQPQPVLKSVSLFPVMPSSSLSIKF